MVVYVVVFGNEYEYSEPVGVFSTKEKAEEIAADHKGWDYSEIHELTIDEIK